MTLHTKLSYAKSGVRIVGCVCLVVIGVARGLLGLWLGGGLLLLAELIGIAEEAWPGAYKGTETDTSGIRDGTDGCKYHSSSDVSVK
jgi:hypothetical protein